MNEQQREALKQARDRIHEFNEECEAREHTDIGEAWDVLGDAYNAIDALFTPTKPQPPFYGCADCGCTDIEHETWIETNTDIVSDDCGSKYYYCPQCSSTECLAEEVDELKPYKAEEEVA